VRERLLETALALFTRHGFDGVSMRRLAREAGATPAMIHYYFGDKHGLFRALLEEVLAPRLDELESLAGKRPVTLAEFMGVFISMFAEHPWIPPLVFREVVDGPVDVRRRFAQRMVGRVFPILTGALAAETVVEAAGQGDFGRRALAGYRKRLEESFVLKDLKLYRNAPKMLHIERMYEAYPEVLCGFFDRVYRIDGTPMEKLPKLFLRKARERMSTRDLLADAFTAWRAV
jgi:AcrR family transcriptional regulator